MGPSELGESLTIISVNRVKSFDVMNMVSDQVQAGLCTTKHV